MQAKLVEIKNVSVKKGDVFILKNINLHIGHHQQWAITGNSGSGKTTLANAITGKIFYNGTIECQKNLQVALVEQQHHFKNLSNTSDFYYQQRFNSFDAEDTITVK